METRETGDSSSAYRLSGCAVVPPSLREVIRCTRFVPLRLMRPLTGLHFDVLLLRDSYAYCLL